MIAFSRTAVLAALFGAMLSAPVHAQNPAAVASGRFAYDVVSIRPNKAGDGRMRVTNNNDSYSGENIRIKMLIVNAFGLQTEDQISGLPGWADSSGWDINAKMDADSVEAFKKLTPEQRAAERRLMMQKLLAERFNLKFHHDTREMQVYNLVVAKGGPKFKEADPNNTYPNGIKGLDGQSRAGMMMMGNGTLTMQGAPLSNLANILSNTLHHAVNDKTGLTGKYDLHIEYQRDDLPADSPEASGANSKPALETALEEQLGLRLEKVKAPVDLIVVDSIQQPTEN